jgi:hypothetical protein
MSFKHPSHGRSFNFFFAGSEDIQGKGAVSSNKTHPHMYKMTHIAFEIFP